jgi:metal-responsive CopG/Arc/MetJ family transcriptional regulator
MKSLRIDEGLAERLRRAARREGVSESEFIRRAVARAVEETQPVELPSELADIVGVGKLGIQAAHRVGEAFREMLEEKAKSDWFTR